MADFTMRPAAEGDESLIFNLIYKLAEYEKLLDCLSGDEKMLHDALFVQKSASVLIGEADGIPVAYALYFYNFSTFLVCRGLYLEDIFVLPEMRGRGYGKALFRRLAQIAQETGCGRMEWTCLNWNKPSIAFYRSMGAQPQEEWIIHRLDQQAIKKLAEG